MLKNALFGLLMVEIKLCPKLEICFLVCICASSRVATQQNNVNQSLSSPWLDSFGRSQCFSMNLAKTCLHVQASTITNITMHVFALP
jgi:hypothetical protein